MASFDRLRDRRAFQGARKRVPSTLTLSFDWPRNETRSFIAYSIFDLIWIRVATLMDATKGWCVEHTNPPFLWNLLPPRVGVLNTPIPIPEDPPATKGGFVERTTLQNFLFCDLAPKTLNLDRGTAEASNHKRGRAHEGAYARTYSTARSAVRELFEIFQISIAPAASALRNPSKLFEIVQISAAPAASALRNPSKFLKLL